MRHFNFGDWVTWLVFVVVLVAVGLGAGEFFEEVGVLDGGGDFVVAGGPLAEVEEAAAVGAEGELFVGGEDDFRQVGQRSDLTFEADSFVIRIV